MKKLFFSVLFVGAGLVASAQKNEIAEAKKIWGIFELTLSQDPNPGGSSSSTPKPQAPNADQQRPPAGGGGRPGGRPGGGAPGGGSAPAPKPAGTFVEKQIAQLNNGLSHIDKAVVHAKTKDVAEAWVYKALFHCTISAVDTLNFDNALKNKADGEAALAKVKALDTKNEFKDFVTQAESNIHVGISARGITAYNKKDYKTALENFEALAAIKPDDASWALNAGVAANLMQDYNGAIKNFKKVINLNSPDSKDIYGQIVAIALENLKDTTQALALLDEALAKFPDDNGLIGTQTDIYIATNNIEKSQASLQKLISKDPSKAIYQYLMGETYYKQALQMQETRNKIDSKKVKEYDAVTAQMTALIDKSLPFYKKSLELDGKFVPTLETLKQIYGFKNDITNFNDIKKRLDELPKQ